MVKELLLGDNPFIGVSHLAHEKARETLKMLSLERKLEIVEAAVEAGATGFTFSTHPANLELLTYMKDHRSDLLKKLNYYILVPYAARYVREATKTGLPGLVKNIVKSNLKFRNIGSMLIPKPVNFIKLFLFNEVEPYLEMLPRGNVKAVLLHEVLTEIIMAFNLGDIVFELSDFFKEKGIGFGLETRNVAKIKMLYHNKGKHTDYVMTPMNALGYQMTPSKEEAEEIIAILAKKGVKIIAINVLASGALALDVAITYLARWKDVIYAVAVGTSSRDRAFQNFRALSMLLTP